MRVFERKAEASKLLYFFDFFVKYFVTVVKVVTIAPQVPRHPDTRPIEGSVIGFGRGGLTAG